MLLDALGLQNPDHNGSANWVIMRIHQVTPGFTARHLTSHEIYRLIGDVGGRSTATMMAQEVVAVVRTHGSQ